MIGDPLKTPGQRGPIVGCCIVLVAAIGLFGAMAWSNIRASIRARNEMDAGSGLKILASAEAYFRANDHDGNGVKDLWTGDIAGLSKFGLIDRALAEADAEPLAPLVPKPIPYKGYLFRALDADDTYSTAKPYRQDTDGKSGKVHNLERFGFVAFPAEPEVTGRYMWILNENNSALRHDLSIPVPRNWPADGAVRAWSKVQ